MKWLMAIPVWSTPRDSLNRFNLVFSRCPYEESPFRYNDFSGMALNGFDWTGAELQQCTFDDTRLAGASFYGVRLGGTRFTRCDLQKADLRTAEEYAIDLETNKLKGARFSFPDVVRLLDGTGIVIE